MISPVDYLRQVSQETKKVSWPSAKQTQQKTAVVVVITLGLAIYIGVLDAVFQELMEAVIKL